MKSHFLNTDLEVVEPLESIDVCTYVCVCVCQVVTLRTVHEKMLRLLPAGTQQALTPARVFQSFSGLNPLHYNPYTEVAEPSVCVCVVI